MLKKSPNFALYDRFPVKNRGGVGEISGSINEALRTFGLHLMAIHGAAAEHSVLIKKKGRKKERLPVKLKAFQHTSPAYATNAIHP